ncbi:hypothetical protein ACWEU9_04340 [Staphylococcus xylosus]
MLMANPGALDELAVSELKKMMEKKRITNIIAPEHSKRHHDHENKMKSEEKILIEQTISHCNSFRSEFEKSAKGDWVDNAMSELGKIGENLKQIID